MTNISLEPGQVELETDQPVIADDNVGSLLGLLAVLAQHKWRIIGVPLVAAIIAAGWSWRLPNIYTASSKLLPPRQNQPTAIGGLGQLGAMSGIAGGALGIRNPNEVYLSMLRSRAVSDELIQRFDLQKVYETSRIGDARGRLAKNTKIGAAKDGIISIDVEDTDPKRAAEICNGYADALEHLTFRLAVTEASQRRLFMEKQLQKSKQDLISAEVDLKKFQEDHSILEPHGQAAATISASAALRAQLTAKEVQLVSMRTYATVENPDLVRVQQELAGLRAQLGKMESNKEITPGDVIVPLGKVPGDALEYLRRAREVKYQETLFELFAKQYESAKIDESKNPTLVQVLDKAIEPERKSRPARSKAVLTTAFVAFFMMVLLVIVRERMRKFQMSETASKHWKAVKRNLGLRN
ncbi:MAG: Wzz/FepE/Etk N-terminal domain-containing protein [Pseudomonadota bacterium]